MRHNIICGGLVTVMLVLATTTLRAEVAGIKDVSECSTLIQNKTDLLDALNNLSPQSQQASKYFQADQNRFVFCVDPNPTLDGFTSIKSETVLSNSSNYPVIIYGLFVHGQKGNVGQSLLTTTGLILLQKFTATNLRGPFVMNGEASIKDSVLSCDTSEGNVYANPILELKGSNERVNKLTITNCKSGISVAGFGNILTDVVITKDEMMTDAIDTGVILGGDNIITSSLPGKSFIGGTIKVTGGNVIISKSILAGDPAAVQIAKGLTGVKVTQNTYPFKSEVTIAYVDPVDAKDHALFDKEWIVVTLSDNDPENYAKRVFGKLMDQNSPAKDVEFYLNDAGLEESNYIYSLSCPVREASAEMCFPDGDSANKKCILKGEKIFDCSKETLEKEFQLSTKSFVKVLSNSPTVSVMSDKITIDPKITIVAIAQPSVPIGSDLTGDVQSDSTGDETPDVPDPTDTGENSGNSGNNATSDGFALDGGTPSGYTAGASPLGSCTLSTVGTDQGQTASALVWLLALLPLPLMIPFRNSKKDDE